MAIASFNIAQLTPEAITLSATDADADALNYSIVSQPMHGALTGTAPNLTYTPALLALGTATLTVSATDSGGTANGGSNTSAPHSFSITVIVG